MRLSDNQPHRHRLTLATLFLLALALTGFGIAGFSSQAKAGPVSFSFDNGRVSIGELLKDKTVLPAPSQFPSPDLPAPQLHTDIQLNGTETNGKLSFPAATNGGINFPYMYVLSPTDPTLKVPLTIRILEPGLTGSYDAATGKTSLKGNIDVVVVTGLGATPNPLSPVDTGVPPLGLFGRCRIPNVPVDFSTENKSPITAERFKDGFGKNGAMTTSWTNLPDAVAENSSDEQKSLCNDQLNTIIHTPGGLWLSNGVVTPKPQPVVKPTCADDLRLCPVPTYVEISKVRVTPKKRSAKPGQKKSFKVKVRNAGTRKSKGTVVKIRFSSRKVKVRKKITLNVPAGGTATKTIKVKIKKRATGKARIVARSHGNQGGATIRIKAKKR